MVDVFSGGLIYEFTKEPNNYGLVEIEEETGNVNILEDYLALKSQYQQLPKLDYQHIGTSMKKNMKDLQNKLKLSQDAQPQCLKSYPNLDISKGLPKSFADQLIERGVDVEAGRYVALSDEQLQSKYKYIKPNGETYVFKSSIERVLDHMASGSRKRVHGMENCTYHNEEIHKAGHLLTLNDFEVTNEIEDIEDNGTHTKEKSENGNNFLRRIPSWIALNFKIFAKKIHII